MIKNPAKINFDTFEILDNNKSEKRHQPTLENLQQVDKVAELIRQGIKNANGIIIKNERLNEPTSGSFSDSLKKDETILWEGSAIDPKYAITPSKRNPFDFIKTEAIIPILIGMFSGVYIIFHDQLTTTGEIVLVIATLLSLAILYLNRSKGVAEFALSNKRILIKSNYSKQRIIYDIPLSQLNNCIVVEKNSGRGTIFLALKNPEEIQFETFTIKDNNEIEKRHQPTLENIKNPQAVAKLIRQGIQQIN